MSKIRVHELAKELGLQSKDIMNYLNTNGKEIKSAQSGLEDADVEAVKKHFQKKEAPKTAPKADAKKETPKKDGEAKPKKKSTITAVFNAQYSKDNHGNKKNNANRNNDNRKRDGQRDERRRTQSSNSVRPAGGLIKPRAGVDHIRRQDHAVEEPYQSPKKAQENENKNRNNERKDNARNNEKRNDNRVARQGNDNKNNDRRRQERPQNQNSDRNNSRNNDRNSNRSNANVAAAAPMAEHSKKGSHGANNRNNNRRDYDRLGKKQEHYVNLEKNGGKKKNNKKPAEKKEEVIKSIKLPDHLTIRELADRMKIQPSDIIKKLFLKGQIITLNTDVDYEQAEEIALEYEILCEHEEKVDVIAELLKEDEENQDDLTARPPVVCVMGHVDHGKTSLLDAIRDTKITDREAGGITQAIGAYVVNIDGQKITFLDTPGHEAFTAMRMRGANSTDIAILVVAADDGVMPQTVEAINHAKAAGVEIIVAVNKMDKPSANIERVKQELSEYELIPEDWGGSTIFCPVSAKTHDGIENLLEMILLTADVLELKANAKRNARGLVIESKLEKGRGTVATVLVQKGTLHIGDPIAAGSSYGKVRAMIDDNGKRVKTAGPSTPVEILGLSEVPNAGEIFVAMDSEKDARSFAETFITEGKKSLVEDTKMRMSLDDLYSQIQSGNVKELNIIVKADVQGSVEAIKQSLLKLSNDEVVVKIIHGGVGAITESDVVLASASNAIIIGFNVRPDAVAKSTAESEGVDVRLYSVIYNAIDDVESALKGMLDPIYEEKVIGHAEVRQIFKASDVGNIAGSYVEDGYFQRGCKVRVTREDKQIFEGDLASLKRYKDDVKEVKAGYECGLVLADFNDIAVDDKIEAYIMVEVAR